MRVVELFSGIGSQAKALEKLNIKHEILNTCEWDVHAIVAYDFIHNSHYLHCDTVELSKTELIDKLRNYTLSLSGKTPMSDIALRSMHVEALRAIYSAILKTNNFVNIKDLKGECLPNNLDLMTYSFPCQDLSNVGAFHGYKKGIDRDANNRSGLLWEVERLLKERQELDLDMPKFLLLENVSALLSARHKANFEEWQLVLNDMGYYNHIYCLNATDFGLPQNRYRLLMFSVLVENDEQRATLDKYFENHDLANEEYRKTLCISASNLADYLRTDYKNNQYYKEALACQPNNTESRQKIWENNLQITDMSGNIIAERVATLTTKQDRHPNSGNLYLNFNNGKSNYRYLTPRECIMLMGFEEKDYECLIQNEIPLKKNCNLLTRDKIIRLAGNSIAVNVLEAIFNQLIDIKDFIK